MDFKEKVYKIINIDHHLGNTDFGEWGKKINEAENECERDATQDGVQDFGQKMKCSEQETIKAYFQTSMHKKQVFEECETPDPGRYWETTVNEEDIEHCISAKSCFEYGFELCKQNIIEEYQTWKDGDSRKIKAFLEEEKKKDSPEDRSHAPTPEPPSPNDEPEDEGEKSSRTGGGSIKIDIYGEEEKDDSGSVDIYGGNTDY